MGLENSLKEKSESKLVRILEKANAVLPTPRKVIVKVRHSYNKKEPHLEIEYNPEKVYKVLKELGYDVDVKDIGYPSLSLESLEDGVIPEYDFGETLVAAKKLEEGRRIHARMWVEKKGGRKYYRVEVHTEIYPTREDLHYPQNVWEWLTRARLHIIDPNANYKEGAEIFQKEIEGKLKIYN